MIYVLLLFVALIIWAIYRLIIRPTWMHSRMKKSVAMVRLALFYRCLNALLPHYGREMAIKLSAAISNEVFSDTPTTEESRQYLADNRSTIRTLARSICEDAELCRLISTAVTVRSVLHRAHGKRDADRAFDPIDNLKDLGLFVDDAAGEGFSHYNVFYLRAAQYLGRVGDPSDMHTAKEWLWSEARRSKPLQSRHRSGSPTIHGGFPLSLNILSRFHRLIESDIALAPLCGRSVSSCVRC
jgi:hypothetical protein